MKCFNCIQFWTNVYYVYGNFKYNKLFNEVTQNNGRSF